jgi:O-antigen/teichoic acid export membrane protein
LTEEQKSYRQIFKATSLFGGVQAFNIIFAIIRSKFVAVLLGPVGMGISGLLTSTTGFINGLTNFGLGTSAIKNVASAAATRDNQRIETVISVVTRLVWITGIIGLVITAILSSWLSQITFGNKDFTLAFIWISVTLLFQQLTSGQLVILQGLRKLEYLAKANLIGSFIGLIITVPLYYIWRIDGIVPAIILTTLASLIVSKYYSQKTGVKRVEVTRQVILIEGRDMLKMGFMISMSGLIAIGASYLIRIYISNTGGVENVGLFNAGFAIINTYVGMVFTAMSTDYFPRLSAVAKDNLKAKQLINQQAEIALLILAPMLATLLIYINWVIIILYSQKFIAVSGLLQWTALGIYFKAASWSICFIFLSKGASKLYFWNELLGNVYILIFNIIGYKLAGLEGLGISFLIAYLVYFVQVFLIAKVKYSFSFEKAFYKVGSIQLFIGITCLVVIKMLDHRWAYIWGTILIIISIICSLNELEKRIGLFTLLKTKVQELIDRIWLK